MKYTRLDEDQQRAVMESRLVQLETEHLGHAINYEVEVAKGGADSAEARAAKAAMATLDKAHAEVVKRLKSNR